ncbi:MAG: hypothetical protein QXZ70_00310 [Candidatus Bathyarchaeia archaeon]
MKEQEVDILNLFNQAWAELNCPPVRLSISEDDEDEKNFSAVNGTVFFKPDIIPQGADPKQYLLWFFRHELSHVHHCPYDIKTAYSLEQAAYEIVNDWDLAYLATHIFSNVQIDINYLPKRFGEVPYYVRVISKKHRFLIEQIMQEIYLWVYPTVKSENKEIADSAKEILVISSLERTWHMKVQMIAYILSRLASRNARLLSGKKVKEFIRKTPLLVREDFLHSSIDRFTETYGSISDEAAAKAFFKQWMQPRLSENEIKKNINLVEEKLKTQIVKEGKEEKKNGDIFTGQQNKVKTQQNEYQVSDRPPTIDLFGAEPRLPTSISKPYQKIKSEILENMLWKKYWYKSRAQQTIIQYLSASRSRRPVWALMRYPVEWYIEDEIEDLDIETSMDEGPFIPEVTTLKWVEEPTPHGQSLASGYVPSALIVLDVSHSMGDVRNEAAVAAYIAYLSARRAGGQTATIVFSTGFISTDWNASEELKELSLTMEFGEFTVFPTPEVSRLVSANIGPCFVVIITDGGWQNVEEAVPALEHIVDAGHKLVIFLIKGKEYQDRIELIKRTPDLRLYKISDPEVDLQGLTLSESMKTYKTFLW